MTSLLLALSLCWSPNTEPDINGYRVWYAERHVASWVLCGEPPVPCPVFSAPVWQSYRPMLPEFSQRCAEVPMSLCMYRHPTAMDTSGNESEQPMLLWPPPEGGTCDDD